MRRLKKFAALAVAMVMFFTMVQAAPIIVPCTLTF